MIHRDELAQIMSFVANRWMAESKDPTSRTMAGLPNDFWMNSVGGKTANGGFWVTTLMYTEDEADAGAFKEVLLRWQSRGNNRNGGMGRQGGSVDGGGGPNLIQISKRHSDGSRSSSSSSDGSNPNDKK